MLERVLKQNFFALSAQASVLVFAILFNVLFTHLLNSVEYGLLTSFVSFVILTNNLSDFGVYNAVIQFFGKSFFAEDGKAGGYLYYLFRFRFVSALVVSALIFLLANPLSGIIFHDVSLSYVIQTVSLAACIYSFIPLFSQIFAAVNRYEFVSLFSFVLNALKLFFPLIAMFTVGTSMMILIFGVTLSFAASLIISITCFYYFFKGKLSFGKQIETGKVHSFMFYSACISLVGPLFANSEILLLNYFSDQVQVALFKAGQVVVSGVITVIPVSATFLYSFFVELEATNKREVQLKMFDKIMRYGSLMTIPITFFLFFMADKIVWIYPGFYAPSALVVQIMCLSIFFVFIQSVSSGLLYTKGLIKKLSFLSILSAVSIFLLNIYFIPRIGFAGAAISYTLAYSVVSVLTALIAVRSLNTRFKSGVLLKPFIVSAAVSFLLLAVKPLITNLILVVFSAVIFFPIVYVFLLEREDLELVKRLVIARK